MVTKIDYKETKYKCDVCQEAYYDIDKAKLCEGGHEGWYECKHKEVMYGVDFNFQGVPVDIDIICKKCNQSLDSVGLDDLLNIDNDQPVLKKIFDIIKGVTK